MGSGEQIFQEKLVENFSELMKYINPQVEVAQHILNKINPMNIRSHTKLLH